MHLTNWSRKKTKLFLPSSRKSILGGTEHRIGLKNKWKARTLGKDETQTIRHAKPFT
jgi:hypothetical protein